MTGKNSKFKVGDRVYKPKGYKFPSTIVSVFETTSGAMRVVAEMDHYKMLHIFNENQLELLETYHPKENEAMKGKITADVGIPDELGSSSILGTSLDVSLKKKEKKKNI